MSHFDILDDQARNFFPFDPSLSIDNEVSVSYTLVSPETSITSPSSSIHANCSKNNLITPMIINIFYTHTFQVIFYFTLLIYLFLGVAIVSDIFMCAIDKITSATKTVKVKSVSRRCTHQSDDHKCSEGCRVGEEVTFEEVQVKIWNESVANLTLMALGSSCPEILLSIIEIISSGFKAGELGTGTIVGSAAFNLLIISAACISAVPDGVSKKINNTTVYMISTFFSIFAYIWLLIILIAISPGIIELWEAIVTFALFILLIAAAYWADIRGKSISKRTHHPPKQSPYFPHGCITKKSLQQFMSEVKKIDPSVTDEETVCLAAAHLFDIESHSKAFYRASIIRSMTGAKSPIPHLTPKLKLIHDAIKSRDNCIELHLSKRQSDIVAGSVANHVACMHGTFKVTMDTATVLPAICEKNYRMKQQVNNSVITSHDVHDISVIQFENSVAYAYENEGTVELKLIRTGKITNQVNVMMVTIDHTAISNVHYTPIKQLITFIPGEMSKFIKIPIIDNHFVNPDRMFLAKITVPPNTDETTVAIGDNCITAVTIVDDDEAGTVSFVNKMHLVPFTSSLVKVPLVRENGSDGAISVHYCINNGTAVNGKHFFSHEKCITMPHGAKRGEITIQIIADDKDDCELFFEIEVTSVEIEGDTEVQLTTDRIGKNNKAIVVMTNNNNVNTTKLLGKINEMRDGFQLNSTAWKDQIISALSIKVNDDDNKLTVWLLHVITFHWKIIFALIPPIGIWGGWLTFFTSLIAIGILTAIIGDVASTLGCLININPSLNAITFVAMGTSMPDLFASVTAIRMDITADNAIGNITGSNSVNVFLGLGLPWMLASIFWSTRGEQFTVPTGDIVQCVALYTIVAVIAISVLWVRRFTRKLGGAEVGGSKKWAICTSLFFVVLWILYITLSALTLYNVIVI